MTNINKTILDVINHIAAQHPNLSPHIENIAQKIQGKNNFDINFLLALNKEILDKSKSQLRQDLFVLHILNNKKDGYFVEFGGANGINLSNSYLLETQFNWNGIIAEPGKNWHHDLFNNRKCIIETRCIWNKSGEKLIFNETNDMELSTIDKFSNSDSHAFARETGNKYIVDTISLLDLLDFHNAPKEIDYLSIDTEGSELEILNAFDFKKYKIKIITCEHNYTTNRDKIFSLLISNGYERKYQSISNFDDWYVLK
jgi:FkbM family methyltransferase